MSHGLTDKDGMFSVREVPWHQLGVVLDEHPKTIEEALKLASLDWDVIQRPAKVVVPVIGHKTKTRTITLDGRDGGEGYFVNIRSDTMDPLGVVSSRYTPVQNIEAFSFLASIFGTEMHFETAGSLMGGRRVWVLMRLPEFIEVGGDPIGPYSFIQNSHDGKSSVVTALTPVRIVCNNTLTAALSRAKGRDAQRTYTIRHLGNMEAKLAEARNVLQVAVNYYEQFKSLGDGLARVKASDRSVKGYLERLFPTEGLGDRAAENREQARAVVRSIFTGNGPAGDTTGDSPGTYWTLYNSATEYADWCREERKDGGRFQRSLDDPDAFKATAWDAILDATGVKVGSKNKSLIKI
jgi:phage/plasmid-like protein (TIGR03299 family)